MRSISATVIGTNAAYFDRLTVGDGRPFAFSGGRNFRDDEFFGGVLGATVAARLGLRVGDIITTEKDVRSPLVVHIEGVSKFKARAGAFKGRKAICIDENAVPAKR